MANQKLIEVLQRGVHEWNAWREQHRDVFVSLSGARLGGADLSGADLSCADLSGTDLSRAHFIGADFSGAHLSGAYLSGAHLIGADFSGADFSGAHLSGANLSGANLSHADLSRAYFSRVHLIGANLSHANLSSANLSNVDLSRANLSHANLSGANLSGANCKQIRLSYAILAWVDLSCVKGLETALHSGPSSVDINSVTLPHDEATCLHFLRGVGFTETQIESLPSLLTGPLESHSLFISYAYQDESVAKRLYTDLRKKDVPCWLAPHDLRPRAPILRGLEVAVHRQKKCLLLLSEQAVKSAWIEREVDAALHLEMKRKQDVLFPIRLDNAVLESNAGWAMHLQNRHIGDFTRRQDEDAYREAFLILLKHLKVGKGAVL
jgi:uncharacterized protein YjbI with pentapeptide repeats